MAIGNTAMQFAASNPDRREALLDGASPQVVARARDEEKFQIARSNLISAKHNRAQGIREELGELYTRREMSLRAIKATGQDYGHRVETTDPKTGAKLENFVRDPVVERLDAQIGRKNAELRETSDLSDLPDSAFETLSEYLERLPISAKLISADIPELPPLPAGQTALDFFKDEAAKLADLNAEAERIWEIQRPIENIMDRFAAGVKARAKAPSHGGLSRGHAITDSGARQIATPRHRVGWPVESLTFAVPGGGAAIHANDGVGLICWLLADQIIEKKRAELEAMPPVQRMSEAEKTLAIADINAKIVSQWRITEESFRAARAAGFHVKRPKDTPNYIVLGTHKKTRPAATVATHAAEVEAEFG